MFVRARAFALATASTVALAVLMTHRPAGLASAPGDPTGPTVAAAAWLAWAFGGYLLVAVALCAIGHLVRPPARRAARSTPKRGGRLAPAVVRRLVDAAVGGTAAAVVVAAAPMAAYADTVPGPAPSTVSSPSFDWPGLATHAHDRSHLPHRASPPALLTSPAQRRAGVQEEIVVRRGDSLWTLTARRLGPGASSAQIAAAWPRLYAANRAVIGTNPALIRPGQRLVPPASDPRSPS